MCAVSTIHQLAVGALTAAAYLQLHQQLLMLLLQSQRVVGCWRQATAFAAGSCQTNLMASGNWHSQQQPVFNIALGKQMVRVAIFSFRYLATRVIRCAVVQ